MLAKVNGDNNHEVEVRSEGAGLVRLTIRRTDDATAFRSVLMDADTAEVLAAAVRQASKRAGR